jgi:hypothetical protein
MQEGWLRVKKALEKLLQALKAHLHGTYLPSKVYQDSKIG